MGPIFEYNLSTTDRLCFRCPLPHCFDIDHRACPVGQAMRAKALPFPADSIPTRVLRLLESAGPLTVSDARDALGTKRSSTSTALHRLYMLDLVVRRKVKIPGLRHGKVWQYELRSNGESPEAQAIGVTVQEVG